MSATATKIIVDMVRGALVGLSDSDRADVLSAIAQLGGEVASPQQIVERALAATGGNIERAAAVIGCSRRALQNRMRRFGMGPRRGGRPLKVKSPPADGADGA